MDVHSITTVESALEYLSAAEGSDQDVRIGGDLAIVGASIKGANYHGTVPTALARGMWELQEELYRAVAFALYGEENYKRLTEEQKAQFELVFEVAEGSSELLASLEGFFAELGKGFKNMNSGHKMKTLVAIAATLAVSWGGVSVYQSYSDNQVKLAEVAAESKDKEGVRATMAAQQAAHTEQLRILGELVKRDEATNEVTNRFAKAAENGTRAIIKGASDADHIRINKASFDRDAILEVNQRATKERAEASIIHGEYSVVRADARDGGVTRFWLVNDKGQEFSSVIIDEDFDTQGLNRLWDAVRGRSKIKLEINVTHIRSQVRSASILRVIDTIAESSVHSSYTQARGDVELVRVER